MDELPLKTVTSVVDRLRSVGASIIYLSGRMAQCPYMGDEPLPYLFAQAMAEQDRLAKALDAYKRITEPQEASVEIKHTADEHQLDIEDGIANFAAHKAKKEAV